MVNIQMASGALRGDGEHMLPLGAKSVWQLFIQWLTFQL